MVTVYAKHHMVTQYLFISIPIQLGTCEKARPGSQKHVLNYFAFIEWKISGTGFLGLATYTYNLTLALSY